MPLLFNTFISQIIYSLCVIRINDFDIEIYLNLIKGIEAFEIHTKIKPEIFNVFSQFLHEKNTQESHYFLEYMFEYYFHKNYKALPKNNPELHKQLIREGHNPKEIAKIIRNDDIEKLQEISSQSNFDFDQTIEPSYYERCSFINQKNVTLIDYAAFFSSVKCFKYLLMNNANVNDTGKYAVAGGNEEIIHLCEQNHSSFEGAYETAIMFHRNDIFKYLYENKIEKINLEELGTYCFLYHNYEIFSFLIDKGMNINDSIINKAVKVENIFLVKYFLKSNKLPYDILVFASESKNIEVVKFILGQKGIDINAKSDKGETALLEASYFGYTEIVKLLLEQEGIDINAKDRYGRTALIWASHFGNAEIVKLLLEQEGIDVNSKDEDGMTALIYASNKGHTEIVKLLLEQKGIDINAKDNDGKTAFMIASSEGQTEIVKLLLEQKGIDVNSKDEDGWTALMYASSNGNTEIVKLLLEQEGIDINAEDEDERTALMWASFNGHTKTVKLLLEQEGIDINAKDENGRTALMYASFNGHKEIVKLLLEQEGIDINAKDKLYSNLMNKI